MVKFVKSNKVALVIFIILFIIPFFWFSYSEIDIGGDSSRLYFIDPAMWLKNIAIYFVNSLNSLSTDNPNFHLIPLLTVLSILKIVFNNNSFILNCFFSGLLLSGSFIFTYLSLGEIIEIEEKRISKVYAILGGLFFVFSPLFTAEWLKPLYTFNQILIYPLMFYLFVKFVKTENLRYIYGAVIASFIFAVNFSFNAFPWFLAFFLPTFILLFVYSNTLKKKTVFCKGFLVFFCLFILIQSFQLVTQIVNILDFSNPNSRAIFSSELAESRGLTYFLSVQPYVKLTYSLLNQAQLNLPTGIGAYEFGLKFRYFYYIYIFIVIAGGILVKKVGSLKQKKLYSALMFIFLIMTFFITANITSYGSELYKKLFSIPGFSMYRSFYTKFGMSFAFMYAIIFTFSLSILFSSFKIKFLKIAIILVLAILIGINSWPLLSGMIVNQIIWQSEGVKIPSKMDEKYLSFLESVRVKKLDGRYLSFPLTNEEYQILGGERGGAYFGPSIISILGGKNDFPGFGSFNVFRNEISSAFEKKDLETLNKYISAFNIRYIFHNSDDYIYLSFDTYPYSIMFKNAFPTQSSMEEFIKNLNYQKISKIGKYFSTSINDNRFLPHIYIPQDVYLTDRGVDIMPQIFSQNTYKIRSAVYFTEQNLSKKNNLQKVNILPENNFENPFIKIYNLSPKDGESPPVLEYKKINPTKYRVRVHGAKSIFPLVFLDIFNEKWKLYLVDAKKTSQWIPIEQLKNDFRTQGYKIIEGNEFDQATVTEVYDFISNGWVSRLGDINKESTAAKNNQISFISKNFQGTIQNDNLPNGSILEDLLGKKDIRNIINDYHFSVNGYANSWVINTEEVCKDGRYCQPNIKGGYDFEAVIEFWPQKLFYCGVIISGLTLIVTIFLFRFKTKLKKQND